MGLGGIGRELARWGALSLVSFGANLALTVLFREVLGAPVPLAFATALLLVFLLNFVGLRHWVFDISDGSAARQARRFGLLTLVFRGAEWTVFSLLHFMGAADYRVLVVLVLAASSVAKFVIYRVALVATRPEASPPAA